jgi:prepilin-type N-terminal cleavage/methylation domain-containing protein
MRNMLNTFSAKSPGFTLIEILVVAAIISMLSSIIISSVNEGRSSARDAQRLTDLNSLRTGLVVFFDNNGRYPSSYTELESSDAMVQIPTDPTEGVRYPYVTSSGSGFDVCIAACMEDAANGGGSGVCDVDNGVTYANNQNYIDAGCDPANEYYISF